MPTLPADELRSSITAIFTAAGASSLDAEVVAAALVDAELAGHPSHGVIRVSEYLDQIANGRLVPSAEPEVVRESPTTMLVDGGQGFGQVVAGWVTTKLIDKALTSGMAVAAIRRCGHIGRVGTYPAKAADRGLIGMAFVNGGGTTPRVAPFGGARPIFGTNPVAFAIPVAGRPPIVVDFSTAVVASGKIRVLRDQHLTLPAGWILDRDGHPSDDPADYYNGGMLLPAAGHKGYGLAIVAEVLGGLLSSAGSPMLIDDAASVGNGTCLVAIDPTGFLPLDEFTTSVLALRNVIKAAPPAEGFEEVLVPGEPEELSAARSEGVVVPNAIWNGLEKAALKIGAPFPLVSST